MKTVSNILSAKGGEVWTISSRATVFEALKLLGDKAIGALPVMNPSNKVVGILSERDYARKVILLGKTSRETPVEAIMTPASEMIIAHRETSLEECMVLMTLHHIRHLPVFEGERMIGIISSRDVIQAVIEDKARQVDGLHEVSEAIFTQCFDDQIAGGKS